MFFLLGVSFKLESGTTALRVVREENLYIVNHFLIELASLFLGRQQT